MDDVARNRRKIGCARVIPPSGGIATRIRFLENECATKKVFSAITLVRRGEPRAQTHTYSSTRSFLTTWAVRKSE